LVIERDAEDKGPWFMLSATWLQQWKAFVSNKISKQVNDRVGVLPPRPIENSCLLTGSQTTKGLELNKHYVAVSKDVWTIFHRTYGGGPIIVRETEDIYSADVAF